MSQPAFSDVEQRKGSTPQAAAYRILWIYLIVGLVWILVSDTLVDFFVWDHELDAEIDILKGCGFVLATGFLIKWLLQRELDARERTMEDLRFFRQLTEVSNDPSFVVDPAQDFKLVYVNAAAERHFKLPKEKLLTLRVYDWSADATPAQVQDVLKQCRANGFVFFESRHRLPDGTIIPVEVLLNLMVYHGREYLGGYVHDISQRRQAEQHLHEQRIMLEHVLNSVPQAVFWKDANSRYLGANRVFAVAAGLKDPQEIIGRTDFELPWGPKEAKAYVADDQQVITSGQAKHNIVEPITLADGSQRWIETSKTPLQSPDGKPFGVLGVFEDITERKQAQEFLRRSEQLFSGVFNSSLDALFLVDWNTRLITNCNARALAMFEAADKSEVIGQAGYTWHRVPRDPDNTKKSYEVVSSGGKWVEEVEYTTLKGKHFWGLMAASKLDLPDAQVALVRVTDITSLKQLEQQLRQERDYSRWIIDALPGVFYVLEADGRIRSWNKRLEVVTGRTSAQLANLLCLELLHADDHAHVMEAIAEVFAQGEAQADARFVVSSGHSYLYHFHGRRIELDGRPCILGMGIDMAEREKMEAELTRQLHFQQSLMDTIPVPIYIKDRAGHFLDCNRSCENFLAVTRVELRGKTVADIASTDLAKIYQQKDAELFAKGGIQTYESKVRNGQGELRDVIFHKGTFSDPDGTVLGNVGAILDITDLKHAHERMLLQDSALNAAANGIVITDCKGHILWANPAFTTLSGYLPEEVIGQTPNILKSGRQTAEFYLELWQTVLKGNVWRGELTNKRKDGSIYDEEMTITPVRDAAGVVTHFIAIKQDVTQRKQLEAQYLRAQRMEGIGMLAGGIAHDLNNVLAPIIMSIQILKEMHPDDETAEILVGLQESAQRGADIVRQVLTFARGIKGDRLLLAPKHLIKDMVRVAKEAFPRNIGVHSDVAADLWNVMGDPTQLHQVLLNLCVNARDAMPDGGTLTIRAYNASLAEDTALLGVKIAAGDYTVISVQDSGQGISPELQERIFEPFFTTKDQGKGTGLGLSTVMGIVKSHHGYIKLISAPGQGAEFQIYLPAVKTGEHELISNEESSLPEGHGELVLLVDDEEMIRMVGRDILARHGYRVLLASDGTEAMATIAQQIGKVHLVITDIMMPYMDGVALVRGLRKMAPEIKILACSGLASGASMTNKVDELKRLGVHPVLHKPFTARKLLLNVNHILHNEPLESDGI